MNGTTIATTPGGRKPGQGDRGGPDHRLLRDWRSIGGLGQVATVGLIGAVVLTVVMGFSIIGSVRLHLVEARSDIVAKAVDDLPQLAAQDVPGSPEFAEFASAVQRQLLGGEVQRVKVWLQDGTIIYSDDTTLIGEQFPLTEPALAAFSGETTSNISDLSDPAHAGDREAGSLLETYVPRGDPVDSVVEVEQTLDSLESVMADVSRNVWLSIGLGVGVLAVFLGVLGVGVARALDRRRRQAEALLDQVFESQDEERRKIVGVLHDDLGQSLYRLHYGIEGSIAKLPADHDVTRELSGLDGLVRDMDVALRAELDELHRGLVEDAGLEPSLRDLTTTTVAETELVVRLDIDGVAELTDDEKVALFRAAQEAVVNVRKHADAGTVRISVVADAAGTRLEVQDDGRGGPVQPALGLSTSRARLERLGGSLEIRQPEDGGIVVTAWVPTGGRS